MSEKELEQNIEKVECSDEELEQVAGGAVLYNEARKGDRSDCICAFCGGGTADEYQKSCACIAAGGGEMTEKGREKYGTSTAMWCVLAGADNVQ